MPVRKAATSSAVLLTSMWFSGRRLFIACRSSWKKMKKSTVRMVDHIGIEQRRDRVIFTFHGTGFLQNMVRILVGTLLEVGRGYWEPAYVQEILAAKDHFLTYAWSSTGANIISCAGFTGFILLFSKAN